MTGAQRSKWRVTFGGLAIQAKSALRAAGMSWAGAGVYVLGQVNSLFDRTQQPYVTPRRAERGIMKGAQIRAHRPGLPGTAAAKACDAGGRRR